ncbi:MAG: flagellar biosynthetic protein FliR [Rhodothermales bacterium]|nr:flagellar biosynthetic protein FliR [Rhodothermales bacterium]MBO6780441.1 flagellar biosynthetic protein FliR [Rhodothermales bacterium]
MRPEELLDPVRIAAIFLIFVRVGAMMTAAPVFGHKSIPTKVRLLLAIMLSWVVVGFVSLPPAHLIARPLGLVVAIGIELLTGLVIGFAAQFLFWGVQYATDVLGFQMGLAMAAVFDPTTNANTNPLGRIVMMVFLLVFIMLDGHHMLLQALVISFEAIPLAGSEIEASGPHLLAMAGGLFSTGLRIASPFMVTFFLVESAMGIFARVVPQADLFSLGMPIKLLIGLSLAVMFVQNLIPLAPELTDAAMAAVLDMIDALR